MPYQPGSNFTAIFGTFVNGAHIVPETPGGSPAVTLYRNGVPDLSVSVAVNNVGLGQFTAAGTIPLSYATGDSVFLLNQYTQGFAADSSWIPLGVLTSPSGPQGYILGATFYAPFITRGPTSPYLPANASVGPAASLLQNGTVDPSVSVSIASLGNGLYVAYGVVPTTYALGDDLQVVATWTLSGGNGLATLPLGEVGGLGTAPSGIWSTLLQVQQIFSQQNINIWSANPVNNLPDPVQQQGAFNTADGEIISLFAENYCVVPAPLAQQTQGTQLYAAVNLLTTSIEPRLAGVALYTSNGQQDSTKGQDGKNQMHYDLAIKQLKNLLFLNRGGFVKTTGYQDAPVASPQTVDPSGNWVDPYPPYPVPRWTGYRYVWQSGGVWCGAGWNGNGVGIGCG